MLDKSYMWFPDWSCVDFLKFTRFYEHKIWLDGIEPPCSGLQPDVLPLNYSQSPTPLITPVVCTTDTHVLQNVHLRRDSNPRHPVQKTGAHPLSYEDVNQRWDLNPQPPDSKPAVIFNWTTSACIPQSYRSLHIPNSIKYEWSCDWVDPNGKIVCEYVLWVLLDWVNLIMDRLYALCVFR